MNGITEQTLNTQIAAAGELAVQTKTLLTRMIEDPMSYIVLPAGQIALIVVLTIVALRFVDRIVDKIFDISRMESKKAQTLRKLIKSIARYAIYFISALTILINLGFDPLPVLPCRGSGLGGRFRGTKSDPGCHQRIFYDLRRTVGSRRLCGNQRSNPRNGRRSRPPHHQNS